MVETIAIGPHTVFCNTTVYITIGFLSEDLDMRVLNKKMVAVGDYPDTVMDSALRLREEAASEIVRNTMTTLLDPENLYYMVYWDNHQDSKPFLFSDNSPENRWRRNKMTILQKLQKGVKIWFLNK